MLTGIKIQTGLSSARVPQESNPDKILFVKGSIGIKAEAGFSPASGPGELRSRAEWLWPRFGRGHGRGQGQLSVFVLSADVVLNGRE